MSDDKHLVERLKACLPLAEEAAEELTRLRLRLEEATIYARMLAVNIHDRNYHDAAPWTPKRDLLGLLTQIDNMAAGLRVDDRECR